MREEAQGLEASGRKWPWTLLRVWAELAKKGSEGGREFQSIVMMVGLGDFEPQNG